MLDEFKNLTAQDELIIIEEGLKTRFWMLIQSRVSHQAFTSMGAALSEKCPNRDWQSGRASGLKEAYNYPVTRIRLLKSKIEQEKQAKKA